MSDIRFLTLLADRYPNVQAASAEIINLSAILALPKGTEYFFSDLHGEHEAFVHMLKSCSGTIKDKIDERFGDELTEEERDGLAALFYDAGAEIRRRSRASRILTTGAEYRSTACSRYVKRWRASTRDPR